MDLTLVLMLGETGMLQKDTGWCHILGDGFEQEHLPIFERYEYSVPESIDIVDDQLPQFGVRHLVASKQFVDGLTAF